MPRDHRLYLDDIIEAAGKIAEYVGTMDFEAFEADGRTVDAVVRNLEIIGEAARYLPEDVRAGTPEIEWKKVVGLRNILAHRYFGVNTAIVWEVALKKVPLLEATCKRLLEE